MSYNQYIYKLVYIILHSCFTVLSIVYSILKTNVDFCHAIVYSHNNNKNILSDKIKCITKSPKHLTVLLGHEVPSYKDLANIIIWCTITRIPFISFYDYKGVLKKQQAELEFEVNERKQKEDHIIWHNDPGTIHKNGYIGRKIHVKILAPEDGKLGVVNLCREISEKNVTTDFSINNLDKLLSKQFEFPDPEMGLYCGDTFSLYNYPQWQIRVTEFLNINTHHNITFEKFVDSLLRYNKCEQRFGT